MTKESEPWYLSHVMKYQKIEKAIFIARPNRFIAEVTLNGTAKRVHVKNTGRCRELLTPGCTVYLAESNNLKRKTGYDLIAVEKVCPGRIRLINMDSQIPNDVAEEWLKTGTFVSSQARIRREVTHGDSRFDFYLEDGDRKIFLEVKGVTLESDGIAEFPDAPTERGLKHLEGLIRCIAEGYEAALLFIVQMEGIKAVIPNRKTHPAFADTLKKAAENGVQILAVDCIVTETSIVPNQAVPVIFE